MNNKGSTVLVTPIIWTVTLFMFIFLVVTSIRAMEPFIIYQKISETSLKYIFVMEEFGYLNSYDKNALIKELEEKGLELNRITVNATDNPVNYGEVVELSVNYKHPYKKSTFTTSISPVFKEEDIDINVRKVGVSKR